MKNEKIIFVKSVECRECDGEGYNEYGPDCNKPASMCCGGCYKQIECEKCGGSGELEVDFTEAQIDEALELILNDEGKEAIEILRDHLNSVH